MSAITHSPGFFDFLGGLARAIAPIATVAAPFFPPAAAVAGIANAVAAITPRDSATALVTGPAAAVGSTWPAVELLTGAAGVDVSPPQLVPFDVEYEEEAGEEEEPF